jgi:PTH1 family peptidyl-tRNA hydrolase
MAIQLIVGLGNPGSEYEHTRHNAGFWLLDQLAESHHTQFVRENRYQALTAKVRCGSNDIWLLQPQTFMNRSGQAVGQLASFFKINADQILIVHDELDLEPGIAKLKKGGSTGGHNGLKDVTAALGTQDYWRLRIGIGHPRTLGLQQSVVDFVLHRPRKEEQISIDQAIDRALAIMPLICNGDTTAAMLQLHTIK